MATVQPYCEKRQRELDLDLDKYCKENPIADFANTDSIRHVNAVDYKGDPLCLVKWVNDYRTRKLFPALSRPTRPKYRPPMRLPNNHNLWQEVSTYLIEMFHYIMDDPKRLSVNLQYLIFRDKNDFFAGSWNAFKTHWMPFINEYKDERLKQELYSTLHYGVDTLSFSKHHEFSKPTRFRSTEPNICSIPKYDSTYYHARAGTTETTFQVKRKLFTRRRYDTEVKYQYDQPAGISYRKPIGYRPILQADYMNDECLGIFKTGRKALQCQTTIADMLKKWIKMSAIEKVCHIDHIEDYEDQVSTLLGSVY